ncbi:MAG: hypothetical protein JNN07_21425 [Verrucomicrobiales bacterium]|nr:hypothetical protein [Verrucomicrobiales bacterium]
MGDQIVLALIGAGGRAASHSGGMSRLPGVEFKYVCDIWKDRGAGIMKDLEKVQKRVPQRIADREPPPDLDWDAWLGHD